MRRVLSRTRNVAPFLFSERGSLALTRALKKFGQAGDGLTDDAVQAGRRLRGEVDGASLAGRTLCDCDGSGARLESPDLAGSTVRRSALRGTKLASASADASHWEVVDLEGAKINDLSAAGATFSLVSFRDAALAGADLSGARFVLCDFSGAVLSGVNLAGAAFVGCDFEGAWFGDCNAEGADLSGCTLRDAAVAGLRLDDARLAGTDLRGAIGLSERDQATAKAQGARLGGGWVHRAWGALLGRSGSPEAHRRTRGAVTGTWAFIAIALPALFFGRAACNPVNPDFGPDQQIAAPDDE